MFRNILQSSVSSGISASAAVSLPPAFPAASGGNLVVFQYQVGNEPDDKQRPKHTAAYQDYPHIDENGFLLGIAIFIRS